MALPPLQSHKPLNTLHLNKKCYILLTVSKCMLAQTSLGASEHMSLVDKYLHFLGPFKLKIIFPCRNFGDKRKGSVNFIE